MSKLSQERERLRIARELQDSLLQTIQALTICFHFAVEDLPDAEPAKASLAAVLRRAEEAIDKARHDIQMLRSETSTSSDRLDR